MTANTALTAALAISLLLVAACLQSQFRLSTDQKALITQIQTQISANAGRVAFSSLDIDAPWDTACVVPQYAYSRYSLGGWQRRIPFLGASSGVRWLRAEDPYSARFGLGFAFLSEGRLKRFTVIPSAERDLVGRGRLLALNPVFVRAPDGKRISFTDLDVTYQDERRCYPRNSGAIRFIDGTHVNVGEHL